MCYHIFNIRKGGLRMDMLSIIGNLASIGGFVQQNTELIGEATKMLLNNDKDTKIKDEVVLILDISAPCVPNVYHFLEKKNIDASVFIIRNKNGQRIIDPYDRGQWERVVKDFSRLVRSIYEEVAVNKLHVFISAPSSLAFGIGCVLRNIHRPYVYNYNKTTQSYDLVLIVDDELR